MAAVAEAQAGSEGQAPGAWKWAIRKRVWDLLESENLAQLPRPVHHRIPNFVEAGAAAAKYEETDIDDPSAPQKKVDSFNEILRSVVDWLISQLTSPSHPTRGIPTAVSSLATLLRIPKVRVMFIRSDGTKLLAPLITPASNQQYIQATLCIWLLSFHDGAVEAFSTARVVPRLVEVVKSSTKEKVVRVAVMAFRNLSNKRNFAAEMVFFDALQVLLGDAAHSLLNVTHLGTGLALEDGLVLDRLLQGALESQEDGSDVTECIARALSASLFQGTYSRDGSCGTAVLRSFENQHVSSGVAEGDFESGDESCAEDSALAEGSEYAGSVGAATGEVASEGDSDCASGAALCDDALADA